MQLYRKIERCFLKEDLVKAEELLDQYQKTFVGARGLDWQRYQALWALWHAKKGASARIVIQELEAALRITMKGYQSGLPDENKRLTFEEIAIFNNIAVQYYRMGDRKRSFSYITWLKVYFDQYKLDEEEQAQIYPLILGNYADMLCMQGKLKEAKREAMACHLALQGVCESGISRVSARMPCPDTDRTWRTRRGGKLFCAGGMHFPHHGELWRVGTHAGK